MSIYGLKQASRQWFAKFTEVLIQFGFKDSENDYFLFTLRKGTDVVLLLVYVDDVIITGISVQLIQSLKSFIHDKFHIKDLGHLKHFLGLEVAEIPLVFSSSANMLLTLFLIIICGLQTFQVSP